MLLKYFVLIFVLQTFAAGLGDLVLARKIDNLPLTAATHDALEARFQHGTVADLVKARREDFNEFGFATAEVQRFLQINKLRLGMTDSEIEYFRRNGRMPKVTSASLVEALNLSGFAQNTLNALKIRTVGELAEAAKTGLQTKPGIGVKLEAELLGKLKSVSCATKINP